MSMSEEMTIQCPECGKTSEVTVFQSINDSWPDAVNKIINGELFAFTCPYCGRKDHLEYDILFNDFGHQAWIQVVHEPELIPSHEKLFDFQIQYMQDVRFRIVHTQLTLLQAIHKANPTTTPPLTTRPSRKPFSKHHVISLLCGI